MGGRRLVSVLAVAAGLLASAPTAHATFHDISIREVYPGSLAAPDSGYVELQMYFGGQQFVGGHALTVYDSSGASAGTFTFGSSVANGANQQTILIGDDGVGDAFGVAPDLIGSSFAVDPAGGAACWAGSIDCVSWGAFAGSTPSASGTPADPLGIPDGMALRRSTAPGCPTLLELGDDTNDSATDLFDATPQPRNNASAIAEMPCTGPAAAIDAKPANPTSATSAAFAYHSTPAGASFECRLDAAAYASCPTGGIEYPGPLSDATHTFQVRAKSEAGAVGSAASYSWRVDTVAPSVTIDTKPVDESPGASVTFTFHASESGVSFQCSLVPGAEEEFTPCASGKTYEGLEDGEHTFRVKATDTAGNEGAPTPFAWTVDNTAADTTPPDTAIDSAPPDPSASSTASFTYHSTEPESSFECMLDGSGFAACPASGVTYTGLGNGSHTFQVRAADASENTDPTPAGHTFSVALPQPPPPAEESPPPTTVTMDEGAPPPTPRRKRRKSCRAIHRKAKPAKARKRRIQRCQLQRRCGKLRGRARRRCLRKARRCGAAKRSCQRRTRGSRRGASASTFHLVLLREVYPGSAASPDAEYVELQMYASGQELVKGHRVDLFDAGGGSLGSVTFAADVARGASQSTVLLASPEAESRFGIAADQGFVGGKLDPAGGAACWEALDCVSWGGFHGALPSPAGNPVDPGGIPDGMALRRTIAPHCPTLLELGDDTNDSAADLFDAFPSPRPNSVPPSEHGCAAGGGGSVDAGGAAPGTGGSAGRRRPQTRLRRRPARRTRDRTPTFRFTSNRRRATFLCRLDRRRWRRCRSPFTTRRLKLGRHVFRVKARIRGGGTDRSPASWHFKVIRRR